MSMAYHCPASITIAKILEEQHASGFSCFSEAINAADGLINAIEADGYVLVRAPACHGLTAQQHKTLMLIARHIEENGAAPTYREIADHLGIGSKSGVTRIINGLEERGAIVRIKNRARCISLTLAGARHAAQQKGNPNGQGN